LVSDLAGQQQYRRKVRRCLDALARMLTEERFPFPQQRMGLELELNLVDEDFQPAMANTEVLEKIDNPAFTTELGQHNLEINMPPRALSGNEALELEQELQRSLVAADVKASDAGASLVMIGMLPTLRAEHWDTKWISPVPRYAMLNDKIFAARGEQMLLNMEGSALPGQEAESLYTYSPSILPESACTSVQLHLQVAPEEFAAHWNAAQCLAGIQVALAANSPFLLNKALWHETRIPLFQQSTDTRPEELKNQGVRPRVWFGERWVTSIFDLFEENVRYFPGLLQETDAEDPLDTLDSGRAPALSELRLHNGTVWRWNRPVYDITDEVPHLRVENRVLPAGPTVLDLMANAALFYGVQRAMVTQEPPVWTQMSFSAAEDNFYAGARHGMDAKLYWPGCGWSTPDELVLRKLLPLAHAGLADYGVDDQVRDRYLRVIEQRCLAKQTGASWQRDTVAARVEAGDDRSTALRRMLADYVTLMRTGDPVHSWPV
jgi:gamma-glutamyl:cysteine ligase YbdK (ATP-grasp superfamily)